MRIIICAIILLGILAFSACNTELDYIRTDTESPSSVAAYVNIVQSGYTLSSHILPFTFEEMLQEPGYVTDVAVVQYVGQRPFGTMSTEFEFIVTEWVWGGIDAERIFVYLSEMEIRIFGSLSFDEGTEYLLPLNRETRTYTPRYIDAFEFLMGTVVNLTDPSSSTMARRRLYNNAAGIDFKSGRLSREFIIAYVRAVVQNNEPAIDIIRSDVTEDIINGSPYVLVVESAIETELTTVQSR